MTRDPGQACVCSHAEGVHVPGNDGTRGSCTSCPGCYGFLPAPPGPEADIAVAAARHWKSAFDRTLASYGVVYDEAVRDRHAYALAVDERDTARSQAERWRLAWVSACRDRSKMRHELWALQGQLEGAQQLRARAEAGHA